MREGEAAAAARGERPPLREGVSDEEAAEQLLAAEEMFRASPEREAAKCWRVESLILCRAYAAAEEACCGLHPDTPDAAYLVAECQWRSGELEKACCTLRNHLQTSEKCRRLGNLLERLQARTRALLRFRLRRC